MRFISINTVLPLNSSVVSVLVCRSHLLGGRLSLFVQYMKINWKVRSAFIVFKIHYIIM